MADNWSNDFSDINNINRTMGSNGSKNNTVVKEPRARFIDHFYPFVHTARIEQLYVMETTSKEALPNNLVTAGERAEYVEMGVRYGFKESMMILVVYFVFLVLQLVGCLKYPSPSTEYMNQSFLIAALIPIVYGVSYSAHISKYNVGHLTAKVINSILFGRLMILTMALFMIGWALWALESYVYSNVDVIITISNALVPSKSSGSYSAIANALSVVMTPFGGGFTVTESSLAYSMTVIIPELLSTWGKISIVTGLAALLPIIIAGYHKNMVGNREQKAQEELNNY